MQDHLVSIKCSGARSPSHFEDSSKKAKTLKSDPDMQLMERNAILQEFLRGSLEPETTQPRHKPLNSKLKAIKRNEEVNKDDFYEDFYFKGIHLRTVFKLMLFQ